MKKLASFLLTVCMCLSIGVIFTACEEESGRKQHKHTYKTEWSKDATHHWHTCETSGCAEISDKSVHNWNEGEIITETVPEIYGSKIFTCIDCGQTKNGFPAELITTMTGEEYYLLLSPLMEEDASATLTVWDDIGTVNQTKYTVTIDLFGEKKVAVVDYYKYVDGGWVRDYSKSCIRVENGSNTRIYSPSVDRGSYENCSISTDVTTLDEFIESIMNNGFPGMAFMEWSYDDVEKAYVNPENENHKMYRRGSALFLLKNDHRIDVTNIGETILKLPEDFPLELLEWEDDRQEQHTCVYKTDWACDETYHWHECESEDCSEISDKAEHSFTYGVCVYCDEIKSSGLEFTLNSDNVSYSVTGIGSCTDTDIIIPKTYNTLPVTNIGENAFHTCKKLTSITIFNNIESIGKGAFANCTGLTAVYISDISVWCNISFSNDRFANPLFYAHKLYLNGELLTTINVPDGVMSISSYAFKSCTSLEHIIFSNDVISIEDNAFEDCSNLISVTFGDDSKLKNIGDQVFYNCTNLESIIIPNSIEMIGNLAFQGTSLNYNRYGNADYLGNNSNPYIVFIRISPSVETCNIHSDTKIICYGAFHDCYDLRELTIPNGVITICGYAFSNCHNITEVLIPNSVINICDQSFYNCKSLTIYCEATTKIDGWDTPTGGGMISDDYSIPVVWDCNNNDIADDGYIYSVINGIRYAIKDSFAIVARQPVNTDTTAIDNNILYKGTSYSIVGIGDQAFENCASLTSIIIPKNVTVIGNSAFNNCTSLANIIIPNGVTTIGWRAFQGCQSLLSITIPSSVTSMGGYVVSQGYGQESQSIHITIFCEFKQLPKGWDANWNNLNCPVVWDSQNNDVADNGCVYTVIENVKYAIIEDIAVIAKAPININTLHIPQNIIYKGTSYNISYIADYAFYMCFGLNDVYYTGSENDWNNISIGSDNYFLTNATIHYNYSTEG